MDVLSSIRPYCPAFSSIFAELESLDFNEQRIHVIAWTILSVSASISSVVLITLAVSKVIFVLTALLSIPCLLLAGYGFWQSNYVDEGDSNERLSCIRKEMSVLSFSQLQNKYGGRWCEVVIGSKLLNPAQFADAYREMVNNKKMTFCEIITSYYEVNQTAQRFNRKGRSVQYVVPHPREWPLVWELEVARLPFEQLLEKIPFNTIQSLQILDPKKEAKMKEVASRYLTIKGKYNELVDPIQASYQVQILKITAVRNEAIAVADKDYYDKGVFHRLTGIQERIEREIAKIINNKSQTVQRVRRECEEGQRALTNGGKTPYHKLSFATKEPYDLLEKNKIARESAAEEERKTAEQALLTLYEPQQALLHQEDLEAQTARDLLKQQAALAYSKGCTELEEKLRDELAPFDAALHVSGEDLKTIYTVK